MMVLTLLPLLAGILFGCKSLDAAEILYTPVNELLKAELHERGCDIVCRDEAAMNVYVRFELYAADMLRVSISPEPIVQTPSYLLSGEFPDASPCEVKQEKATIRLVSAELEVVINISPLRFVIYNAGGNLLVREYGPFGIGVSPPGIDGKPRIRETFAIPSWRDEAFFGLGQKFGRLDKKGSMYSLYNVPGGMSRSGETPINVPLLLHTKGYGVFVHSYG